MQQGQSSSLVSILFLGDVIGKPGRSVVKKYLQHLKAAADEGGAPYPDFVVVNVENAAHGFGVTKENLAEFRELGVDVFSGGNHTFDRKEIFEFIETEERLLRPGNYPEGTPGKGLVLLEKNGIKFAVINLMGRVFMEPLQSPFLVADKLLESITEKCIILVDMHAEATAEKVALGWYLDGRVSAIVGSHTHIQTADERLLKKGTAYITDAGACGPTDGVIGMALEGVMRRMVKQLPSRFDLAEGPAAACGVLIKVDSESKCATSIERIRFADS